MARKVGKIHNHEFPSEREVSPYEVWRCNCGKEFFVGLTDTTKERKWYPLDNTPHYVEYGEEELDSPLIGRYTPEFIGVPRPPAAEPEETATDDTV